MKKLLIILFFISLSAASINVNNYNTQNIYTLFSNISGSANLTVNSENYNKSIFLSNGKEMGLGDFLKSNDANFTCIPTDCSKTYAGTPGQTSENITLSLLAPKYIGFILKGGNIVLDNISFRIRSNFKKSDVQPLTIKFFGEHIWKFNNFSSDFSLKNWGCFDPIHKQTGPLIGDSFYCEMINIKKTSTLKIGADVDGTGNKLDMAIYSKDGFGESWKCSFNPQTESGCTINTTSGGNLFEGNYQVCVGADTLTSYRIYEDNIGENCGFAYNDGPKNSTKDYAIFAQGVMFSDAASMGEINFTNEDTSSANNIISSKYGNNCSAGCVLPLEVSGLAQNLNIYGVKLIYTDNSEWKSSNLVRILKKTPAKINFNGTVDLKYLNIQVSHPGVYYANISGNYLFMKNIKILPAPIISSLFPLNPPAGVPVSFHTNINFKGNKTLRYQWDFGDGSEVLITEVPYVTHSYKELKNYTLSLNVSAGANLTSSSRFHITAINPEVAVFAGLKNRKKYLEKVKMEIAKFPAWYNNKISSALNITSFDDELNRLVVAQNNSVDAEDFKKIALTLYSLNIPVVIGDNTFKTPFLTSRLADVNIEPISIIAGGITGANNKDYKKPILTWQNENTNVSMTRQVIFASLTDGTNINVLTVFNIKIISNSDEESYFVINKPFDELYFNGNVDAKKAGQSTVIIIKPREKKNIEFYYKGKDRGSFFISPRLSSIIIKADINTNCNYNGICEQSRGENSDNCRADCKPVKKTILFLILGFLFFLVAYTSLQIWYKKRYEAYLFRDPSQLYNILMFIANAKARDMNYDRIAAELRSKGWSSERINYAIKKSMGKSVGMIEIIPIEKVSTWLRNRKARRKIEAATKMASEVRLQDNNIIRKR